MNRKYTLKKNHVIEKLFKSKQSVGNIYYAIYYEFSNQVEVSISVSKKLGNAVLRNYQKRVIKEILRKNFDEIKNLKFLVVIKKKSLELSYLEKEKEIKILLKRIRKK